MIFVTQIRYNLKNKSSMRLSDLQTGDEAVIVKVLGLQKWDLSGGKRFLFY